jgi:hypothetical protein
MPSQEKVLFAERARCVILRGKKSLFEKLKSAFSDPEDMFEHRFLLLSNEALYSLSFEEDPESRKTIAKLFFRVPLQQIVGVTLR